MNRFLCLACVLFFAVVGARAQLTEAGDGGPGPVKAQHLTVELTSLGPAIAPGGTLPVGMVFTLEDKWHVYWINAGYAGEPPEAKWTLPAGLTMGPMQFPAPQRIATGAAISYGYEDSVAFPFTLSAAKSVKPGQVHLDAHVRWLVCREVCIPGKAHLGLDLKVAPGAEAGPLVGALGQSIKNLPTPMPERMTAAALGGPREFVITLHTGGPEEDGEFYPIDPDLIVDNADQDSETIPDGIRIRVPRSSEAKVLPATMHGLIRLSDTEIYDVTMPVSPGELPPLAKAPVGGISAGKVTTWSAIGLALLGGIILNLMPCVFPVLFLKGLSLVNSSGEERARMRLHGLVYTGGILVSFWVIVAILLAVRASGSQAGWGFQLQNPVFVVVLASFLFFFALSLAGQFELGLSLTSAGGSLARKQGYTGSFFTGVLATVVATPCVGPFMGAAIGYALAQPPLVTFAVFTALALGLALPYVLLTLQPAWLKLLPKPGAWMEVLKQFTAVPLFATAIFLAWVYGQLFSGGEGDGINHLARLLVGFLIIAIAGWALGRWPAKWGSAIAAALLCAVAIAVPLTAAAKQKLDWKPYSQAALDQARAEGKPVFIDFTAAWCLSCHVNEQVVLDAADVDKQLTGKHFVLLRADWTQYDPEITKQLASIGRSGVPTYVIYPQAKGSSADVLPELLTKTAVLKAIEKDVQ
jgi:thiol:disulfide interchange protein DsbD